MSNSISSVIALPLIIGFIIAAVVLTRFIARHLNMKLNFCIIFGYLALLIVLSLICPLLPSSALVKSEESSQITQYGESTNTLYKRLFAGNLDAPSGFAKAVSRFTPKGRTLNLKTDINGISVCVGTKGVDIPDNHDGKIDVYYYGWANTDFGDISITIKMQAPKISYSGNTITTKERKLTVNKYFFQDSYSAQQFLCKKGDEFGNSSGSSVEQIFVLLPRGVIAIGNNWSKLSNYR